MMRVLLSRCSYIMFAGQWMEEGEKDLVLPLLLAIFGCL